MGKLLLSMITWMLCGYLIGMTVGFTAFDPDTDVYALLGAALAILGLVLGLTPLFRKYVHIALGGIIGFYLGSILSIVVMGNPATDDLLEVVRSSKLIISLIGTLIGIGVAYRFAGTTNEAVLAAFLFGGFFGGLLLTVLGIAPRMAMVQIAPYFIGCGLVCSILIVWWQRRSRKPQTT